MNLNKEIKILAKDTIFYGMSNIIPKFLNWIMVYIYTRIFNENEYGIITELYTYASIINVILTFGMETTLFRFGSNKEKDEKIKYYRNIFTCVLIISILFFLISIIFSENITRLLEYENKSYIIILAAILMIDAISAIPFSFLRLEKKVKKFTLIKIINIIVYIALNLIFIYILPEILQKTKSNKFDIDVIIIFIANLIASISNLFFLVKEISIIKIEINNNLIKEIIKYSMPLLITQLSGILNDGIDRVLIKIFIKNPENALYYLGIYGANIKLALIIVLFTQAFRYAYEPYVFKKANEKNSKETYAEIMKIYIIISLFFYMVVNLYIDYFKYIIGQKFWVGLNVVPIIMISYILSGIAFNLSIWYKLIDKTYYGIIITSIGIITKIIINSLYIKKYTYIACAWSNVISYFIMICISYILEKKLFNIKYDIKNILKIILFAALLISINLILKEKIKIVYLYEIIKIMSLVFFAIICLNEIKEKNYESKNSQ